MLIRWLEHGTGSGVKAAQYLIGTHDHLGNLRAEVNVLRGDPMMVGRIADTLPFLHKYTSGVIAFHPEDDPTPEEIERVINEFEAAAFAGLHKSQYIFCAVEHVDDDGSRHVHILVPRVELLSHKSLNIQPPGHRALFNPLVDSLNWEFGWAHAADPERARAVRDRSTAEKSAARRAGGLAADAQGMEDEQIRTALTVEPDAKGILSSAALSWVLSGQITSRDDLVRRLSAFGEITRDGDDYVSVKPPGREKAVRLKGEIFSKTADYAEVRRKAAERKEQSDIPAPRVRRRRAEPNLNKAAERRAALSERIKARAEHHEARYPLPEPDEAAQKQAEQQAAALIKRVQAMATKLPGPVRSMTELQGAIHDRNRDDVATRLGAAIQSARDANRALERADRATGAAVRATSAAGESLERSGAAAIGASRADQQARSRNDRAAHAFEQLRDALRRAREFFKDRALALISTLTPGQGG